MTHDIPKSRNSSFLQTQNILISQCCRVLLCEATRKVMLKGFELLGFVPLEKI